LNFISGLQFDGSLYAALIDKYPVAAVIIGNRKFKWIGACLRNPAVLSANDDLLFGIKLNIIISRAANGKVIFFEIEFFYLVGFTSGYVPDYISLNGGVHDA
jgi:hypothetical protein